MRNRRFTEILATGALLLTAALCGSAPAQDKQASKAKAGNKAEEIQRNYYKNWLAEDVYYLITEDEKSVFNKLTTDEERDQFIEQFWRRRDPDPKTAHNEFKEEHYRRLHYANETFTCGIPGWKTDRGMVYVKFGPPDHIEEYNFGDAYDRPYYEGLGQTRVFPTQIWEYRFIEGIGSDVELEFVDTGGGNLYTLETNPNAKDLLLHATTNNKTLAEQMGKASQADRAINAVIDGERNDPWMHYREKDRPFAKYELLASVSKPPEIKYKDLKSIVDTRITFDLFPFEARLDYIKISEQQVLVPVTIRIRNANIQLKEKGFGITRGQVNVYGIVTTLSGNFVQEFEDDIIRDFKVANLETTRGE